MPRSKPHIAQPVAALPDRTRSRRRTGRPCDQGGHSVEYAIGIGLGAAAILAVFAAYRAGLADIVASWVFDMTGP